MAHQFHILLLLGLWPYSTASQLQLNLDKKVHPRIGQVTYLHFGAYLTSKLASCRTSISSALQFAMPNRQIYPDVGRTKPPIAAGAGKRWEHIWGMTDEFWRPDLHEIWEPYNRNWSGRQPGFFRTSNVTVKNHRLQLWSREDQPNNAYLRRNGYKNFSTSFIRTKHRQRYGYFEVLCKLMDSQISSAFWFAHNEPSGPDSWWTEIDVFEYSTSGSQRSRINTNLHVHRFGGNWNGTPHLKRPESFETGTNLCKNEHKFALDWTKDAITWYFDDEIIRTVPNYYHHRPMHLQFDSETMPNWFGLPKTGGSHLNKLPNVFEIYYVRSWER